MCKDVHKYSWIRTDIDLGHIGSQKVSIHLRMCRSQPVGARSRPSDRSSRRSCWLSLSKGSRWILHSSPCKMCVKSPSRHPCGRRFTSHGGGRAHGCPHRSFPSRSRGCGSRSHCCDCGALSIAHEELRSGAAIEVVCPVCMCCASGHFGVRRRPTASTGVR
jgi:hypothetical protein